MKGIESEGKTGIFSTADGLGLIVIDRLDVKLLNSAAADLMFVLKKETRCLRMEVKGGMVGQAKGQPFQAVFGVNAGKTKREVFVAG